MLKFDPSFPRDKRYVFAQHSRSFCINSSKKGFTTDFAILATGVVPAGSMSNFIFDHFSCRGKFLLSNYHGKLQWV